MISLASQQLGAGWEVPCSIPARNSLGTNFLNCSWSDQCPGVPQFEIKRVIHWHYYYVYYYINDSHLIGFKQVLDLPESSLDYQFACTGRIYLISDIVLRCVLVLCLVVVVLITLFICTLYQIKIFVQGDKQISIILLFFIYCSISR